MHNIIIYGFGYFGKAYYEYLVKTGMARLLFFIDQKYEKYTNEEIDVKSINVLNEIDEDSYDFLAISVNDINTCKEIKKDLLNYGVKEERIIELRFDQIYEEEHFWEKEYLKEYFFNMFKLGQLYNWNCPQQYYRFVFENSEVLNVYGDLLKDAIYQMNDCDAKIVALRMLYELKLFNSESLKCYMQTLVKMNWQGDTPYYMVLDSFVLTFFDLNNRYKEFCLDKRQLLRKVAEHYKLHPVARNGKIDPKRIVILCYKFILSNIEAYEKLIISYCDMFAKKGYEVHLVITQARYVTEKTKLYVLPYAQSGARELEYRNTKNKNIVIHASDKEYVNERLQSNIETIFDINPFFILDMATEWCPEMFIIQKYYPVINLPLESNNYSSFYDAFITKDIEQSLKQNYKIEREKLIEIVLGNLPDKEKSVSYTRSQFGLKEDDFVLVTVGTRLQKEIHSELVHEIKRIVDKNKRIKWVLVGDLIDIEDDVFRDMIDNKTIIQHGYENHLESFYKLCNVFLQPNRTGGACSIRQAMREGLVIAMTNYLSDAKPVMVKTHIINGGYKELADYVLSLSYDEELYLKISHETYEKAKAFSKENDICMMEKACNDVANKCWPQKEMI